jgi:hypothetical protein
MKTLCWAVALAGLLAGCAEPSTSSLAEYQERYYQPLVSPGAQFASLPPAVQYTIRAETGGAPLANIVRDTNSGRLVYHVYFEDPDIYPPLIIAPDGSVLNPDLTVAIGAPRETPGVITGGAVGGITLGDLPPKVVKTIQQHAPDAEVESIAKETRGDQVMYIVTFKHGMRPALYIAADGTVLRGAAKP